MQSPFVIVIFGATGDLMHRKIMPALYALYKDKLIAGEVFIVGVGRRELTTEQFQQEMMNTLPGGDRSGREGFTKSIHYLHGYFEEDDLYRRLIGLLSQFDKTMNACVPRFFYLSTPPQHYGTILNQLNGSKLSEGCGQGTNNFTRVLIEKPFGNDLVTAQNLEKQLSTIFEEKQIYRIDHYLGKETVQNILAFRFANGIFEPTWNHDFIDHVQIHLSEDIGVGSRGASYDGAGALRDVVQNHMFQMLALTAMDQPRGFSANTIRDARVAAMKAVRCIAPRDVSTMVVRGQYDGYQKETGVPTTSATETFVALKLFVDIPPFSGVPFYLRTGKRLKQKVTEISLHYKKPVCPDDICFFNSESVQRNIVSLHVEPDEGMSLRLMVKKPGFGIEIAPTHMKFSYSESFADGSSPEAYERLLLDAIRSDQTLFARTDEIASSWQVMMGILDGWREHNPQLFPYEAGGWGPKASDDLIQRDGRHWYVG